MRLGDIDHHSVINEADRDISYSKHRIGLANKMQFDIRLSFCRRVHENMHTMTKSNFTIKTDNKTGLRYETKTKDELTKNNWENDKGLVSEAMPESPVETKKQYKNLQLTEF